MLTPLTQFICDTCGELIKEPKEGWIEWIIEVNAKTGKRETHSFRIVHHFKYSPLAKEHNAGCYQHEHAKGRQDLHLHHFIEDNTKMAHILKFLDIGPYHEKEYKGPTVKNMREYVEFVRRLTIPHYEEARLYWERALEAGYFQDSNEIWIYGVDNLITMIERYGNS